MPQEKLAHSKLPPDVRMRARADFGQIETQEAEQQSPDYLAKGLLELRGALAEMARRAENLADPVDEYNIGTLSAGMPTTTIISLSATYEYMPEKILSILVGGPPSAAVTVTIGDRVFPIVIPAAGILPIGPVGMLLYRNDVRQLTASVPGAYFLELMGFANRRFEI